MANAILQDMSLCMECQACRVACQAQNGLPPEESFIRFRFREQGRYPNVTHHIARFSCHHCNEAACEEMCLTGATFKGETGLTHFDRDRCIGCGYCEAYCPFWIPELKGGKASRCGGCQDLVEAGKAPTCVSTCISGALSYGPRAEMLKKAQDRVAAL